MACVTLKRYRASHILTFNVHLLMHLHGSAGAGRLPESGSCWQLLSLPLGQLCQACALGCRSDESAVDCHSSFRFWGRADSMCEQADPAGEFRRGAVPGHMVIVAALCRSERSYR